MKEIGGAMVHESSYVDHGAEVGDGTRIWHFCHVMSGAVIGKNCNIGQNVVVLGGATIGDGVKVQNNVSIYTGVHIADDAFIGPSAVFTNVINPRSFVPRKHEFKSTNVGRGASIGANATVVCGNNIGDYALVAAGSVVTRDIAAFELVIGSPAKRTGWVSRAGHKLNFDADGHAICPQTGEKYLLRNGKVELHEND